MEDQQAPACRRCGQAVERGLYCPECNRFLLDAIASVLPQPETAERQPGTAGRTVLGSSGGGGLVYRARVRCPACGQAVEVPKVATSKLRLVRRHTDLYMQYENGDPNLYWVWVCSRCGFSAPQTAWENPRHFNLAAARDGLGRKAFRKDLTGERTVEDALTTFQQALECAQWRHPNLGYLATIYHRLAWLHRQSGEEAAERAALDRALHYYSRAFETEAALPGNLDEMAVCYLLGELARRLDRHRDAIQHFSRVVRARGGQHRWLEKLAREQWQLARQHLSAEADA